MNPDGPPNPPPPPRKGKLTYRDAGLDLEHYEQRLSAMVPFLKRTHTPRVLDGFGGFASLFSLDYNCRLHFNIGVWHGSYFLSDLIR